jgi:hypothetical protein
LPNILKSISKGELEQMVLKPVVQQQYFLHRCSHFKYLLAPKLTMKLMGSIIRTPHYSQLPQQKNCTLEEDIFQVLRMCIVVQFLLMFSCRVLSPKYFYQS